MNGYSLLISYLLWLTLGLFGAHHFYLRRDRHAFVWFWTMGGFFLGWFCELWCIPSYVKTATDEWNQGQASHVTTAYPPVVCLPPLRTKRLIGEFVFSSCLAFVAICALPDEILHNFIWVSSAVGAIAVAIGVHTIANIGKEECTFKICLLSAFAHFPFYFLGTLDSTFISCTWSCLVSTLCSTLYGRRMRTRVPKKRYLCTRILILSLCSIAVMSLFLSAFYFHGDVTRSDGRRLKVRTAVNEFMASPHYQKFKETVKRLLHVLFKEGVDPFAREFSMTMNPEGEQHAYKVLGVRWNATDDEIRNQYRKLVLKYHPDRFMKKSEEEQKQAAMKFIEVQKSYERLSDRHKKQKHRYKTEF